uniref:PRELI/MSF1 domain-containing protein n=1 Tax=Spongospora subterranea TaxID=70186 RepID=A0A0H5RAZ9_9EUKA|eukprot:CRZ10787.1 hypothetical protein [Spongospora subterranea]
MVRLFENKHTYKHPWTTVSSAFWKKYPNPAYPHVQEIDCFERFLNPKTGDLVTRRLITADTNFPSFLNSLGAPRSAYGIEESTVNSGDKKLVLKSRNLTGSEFVVVEETCTYSQHPDNPDWTVYTQQATITGTAPVFPSRFESHGLSRLQTQAKDGLEVMEKICQNMTAEVELFATEAMSELESLVHDVETGLSHLFRDKKNKQDLKPRPDTKSPAAADERDQS